MQTKDVSPVFEQINLMENATYVVKDGILKVIDSPPKGFGNQVIMWQNGKPEIAKLEFTRKL
jgi:hypothetical protein